jgi:SAM-dependent methyltransferase
MGFGSQRVTKAIARAAKPIATRWRTFMTAPLDGRLAALEARLPAAPKARDVSVLLHHSRTAFLRRMPPGARVLCSAGCSGNWYFEWVERCYGRVEKHIGLEYYTPKPDRLPENAIWIANTVSNMSDIADRSCDLVFSGENLEHLWPDEVTGFFAESWRVLRPGGVIVVDSPNRDITCPLSWSHPEHTVELTVEEAKRLATLSGFDVTKVAGIWLCRDPVNGRILPFDPAQEDSEWSLPERLITAESNPECSFIWWLEAVRSDRVPKKAELREEMQRIFAEAWPERKQRLTVGAGHLEHRGDGDWVACGRGEGGAMIYGPGMPLHPGRYQVTFMVAAEDPISADAVIMECDVYVPSLGKALVRRRLTPSDMTGETAVALDFAIDQLQFGIQFRCISLGQADVRCKKRIELTEAPVP